MIAARLFIVCVVLSVGMGYGCASIPAYQSGTTALLDPANRAKLKIGETTQSQVREWFGAPAIVAKEETGEGVFESWSYSLVQSGPISVTPFGSDMQPMKVRSLGLKFSSDGVLRGIVDLQNPGQPLKKGEAQ